jgi:hypothetical protein
LLRRGGEGRARRVKLEEEQDELGHDLSSGDVARFLVSEEEVDEGNERVWGARADGVRADDGGREGFDTSEEFVKELIVVLFLSAMTGEEAVQSSAYNEVGEEAITNLHSISTTSDNLLSR